MKIREKSFIVLQQHLKSIATKRTPISAQKSRHLDRIHAKRKSTASLLLLASTGSTHLAQYGGHLLSLALGTQVSAEFPLGDLEGALVLADLEQLSDALLVGREAGDLADELADQGGALAELAAGGGRALGDVALGDLVAAVEAHGNAVADHGRCHRCELCGWTDWGARNRLPKLLQIPKDRLRPLP